MVYANTVKAWSDGTGYDQYISEELASFRKGAWKSQILRHLGPDKNLRILDVGTGPGFFSCILSEEGYRVTGIDFSDGMLEKARKNADLLGVSPEFIKMDLNDLTFEDMTFDAIVVRNVTWLLEFPEKVYSDFHRILKPGGTLLIYDANWHAHVFDKDLKKRVKERERLHREKYGDSRGVSNATPETLARSPLTRQIRPEWDRKMLESLDFDVTIREDIGEQVYEEWEKELYGESPLFEICAVRREEERPMIDKMREYWEMRAETFGVSSGSRMEKVRQRLKRYLPEEPAEVLDIGTGPGSIAIAAAGLGHHVTGVDLCSNMIRKAQENAEERGLSIRFLQSPADVLPFPDDSFDAVVCRNLTWALPDPKKAFLEWKRVLRPDGILLYQDSNHYRYLFDEKARKDYILYGELAGAGRRSYDSSLCDNSAVRLPMSKLLRPQEWDEQVLPELNFAILAEEIENPQILLRFGIAEGYAKRFLIAALNEKEKK